ncbi:LAGLIDADG family homing endonuclease [Streptomyces sp. NPDC001985]|uniref:LAGLIDADG family homing endonuclease n=1 Tax=Streptomyces sp. NPDC001985 TaxID=3154406 RepID=UPI00332FF8D0
MTFMDLQDPRYAYMFGFLQADGHLATGTGKKGRLAVELSHRDLAILEAFQRLTPYRTTIRERTRTTNFAASHRSAIWTLCSLEARTLLESLGLPPGRKSDRVAPPRVPFSQPDYLRGIIDADGSVGFTATGLPFVSLTTASTAIATFLRDYTERVFGIPRTAKRNARDGVYNLMYMREAGVTLAQHLYPADALALERKKAAAAEVSAWVRPPEMKRAGPRRRWNPAEDHVLLSSPTVADAAALLQRSVSSCLNRRHRLRPGTRAPRR